MREILVKIVSCLAFFGLLLGCGKGLRYILIDDTTSYTRLTFHEMYEQDNIDVLFVGSSHCYRSFNPVILDEKLDCNTFNAGTSSQALDGSFAIIKEVTKNNNLQHIYLEVYFNVGFGSEYKDRSQLTQTYIISDYLRPSINKYEYLLNASGKKHYINSFITARRNWEKLYDAQYMTQLMQLKSTDTYKNYRYEYVTGEADSYEGKGFVSSKVERDNWSYFERGVIDGQTFEKLSADWKMTLSEIIEYCKSVGIPLTLVVAPMSDYYISSLKYYDQYVEIMKSISDEAEIEYLDFNLCKEEYWPCSPSLYKDVDHLNERGAEIFSNLFSEYVEGRIDRNIFYNSYNERASHLKTEVYGIAYAPNIADATNSCRVISNSEELKIKIELFDNNESRMTIQDYDANKVFTIGKEDHGICVLSYFDDTGEHVERRFRY